MLLAEWPLAMQAILSHRVDDMDFTDAIRRAKANAPFLRDALDAQPDLAALLAAGDLASAFDYCAAAGDGAGDIGVALRKERLALALTVAIGDLAGALSLEDVTQRLSDFADRALDAAIRDAIVRRCPDVDPAGFAAIALGKHGGQELNYSSDIDPILIYDPDTLPRRGRDEPGEAAQRIARQIVETLSARTEHGYVFRVDLRLRPASEVSPLAISVNTAISHYESSALAWEQAAFIRSRAAAGDVALGQSFLSAIRPFIWRRSLDFGTIDEIGRLTAKIRDHYAGGQALGPGFDVKRGRGGIREVEFFAQTHQLIHGGRNPALRVRKTCDALSKLAEIQSISADDAHMLASHYRRLRTIEHRLQMIDDHQTHSLPRDWAALDRVAQLDGMADGRALLSELDVVSSATAARYDALLATFRRDEAQKTVTTLPDSPPLLADIMASLGFDDPGNVADMITNWRGGGVRAIRSVPARAAFEAVLPALMQALAKAPDAGQALNRWDNLLRSLPSAINIFRLLEARPDLLGRVMAILSHAPALADDLARRGDLMDTLIDRSALDPMPCVPDLAAQMAASEAGDDYERLLDAVRLKVGEKRFGLGVQLIEASADPLEIAAGYCRVAEAALTTLTQATIAEFQQNHGRFANSALIILALGRLGGGALTHASDLDVVFMFSGDPEGESDGRRPLGVTHYYQRLAQRVIAALSVPTATGALYEVDTRLRPSGAQGLLAVPVASFMRYQREDAWTWEHMALCRARVVYGDGAALEGDIRRFLAEPRDMARLSADLLEMRATMAQHKPPAGPLDIKLVRGGLVDIEFLVHGLQLRHGTALVPSVAEALRLLVAQGHLPETIIAAHDLFTRLLVTLRLVSPDSSLPPSSSRAIVAAAAHEAGWDQLLADLASARRQVADCWATSFDQTLELDP